MAPAPSTQDHYAILEVPPSADYEQIKTAYRRLARLHHPDKNGGSRDATVKIQRINAAWDVLGDSCLRREYDRVRPTQGFSTSSSSTRPPNSSRPDTARPPPPPRPQTRPTPQPGPTPQEDARARAESHRKRQEWLDFERVQEEYIRQSRNRVKPLEAEIAALNAKVAEIKAKLANDVPYRWNVFASLSTRLSETEKDSLRRQILDAETAMRIKQWPLDREQLHLKSLQEALSKRLAQENVRLAAERTEQERKERLAREKAQAEAQRRRAEEAARQQAAYEAREKVAREERARAEAVRARQMAEEHAARKAEMQKQQAEMKKRAQAAQAEALRQQKLVAEQVAKAKREADKQRVRVKSCRHKNWWDRVPGPITCPHCTRPRLGFAYKCPDCETTACASCRGTLKAGRTPAVDTNHTTYGANYGFAGTARRGGKARRDRDTYGGGYERSYCEESPSSYSYDNYL
ncbi:DnaJ-domain-containing protein [Dothidotthia symphoricarpi CBS 119687]|uniref:DnaJ-domain-containing protein n=1 Tax=Dothidotthia symphoricarpi CBS 119687 TaxID=1392245 RepID=A0A6A6AJZ1_9PLEO|nr:DnaJ-domain-containing protein [Dothidotthia symphoricarpi CBS 119687]KAF2130761.1 DnaJ-domain-containing protein [Dothidotthia symphoricarpi CBS 119687]